MRGVRFLRELVQTVQRRVDGRQLLLQLDQALPFTLDDIGGGSLDKAGRGQFLFLAFDLAPQFLHQFFVPRRRPRARTGAAGRTGITAKCWAARTLMRS